MSQLKIKITRQVGLKENGAVANGSFFNDALEEWKELNLSAPFVKFGLQVRNYCQTLPQLLYHKEQVVDLLVKNLDDGNVLALEPILDLTTQLAKDLDDELFPYLHRLLASILPLVEFRDVKVIEVRRVWHSKTDRPIIQAGSMASDFQPLHFALSLCGSSGRSTA